MRTLEYYFSDGDDEKRTDDLVDTLVMKLARVFPDLSPTVTKLGAGTMVSITISTD